MFKQKTVLLVGIFGLALFGLSELFIERNESNSVKLINGTDQSICLFAHDEQILRNHAGEGSVTNFKVRGDGDFYITDCEGHKTVKNLGYYTRSLSGCHIVDVRDFGASLDWSIDKSACYQD